MVVLQVVEPDVRRGVAVDLGEGQPAVIGGGRRVVPVEPRRQRSEAGHAGIPGAHPHRVAVIEPILVPRPGGHRPVGADARWRHERRWRRRRADVHWRAWVRRIIAATSAAR